MPVGWRVEPVSVGIVMLLSDFRNTRWAARIVCRGRTGCGLTEGFLSTAAILWGSLEKDTNPDSEFETEARMRTVFVCCWLGCCWLVQLCPAGDSAGDRQPRVAAGLVPADSKSEVTDNPQVIKQRLTARQLTAGDPIVNSIGMVLIPIPAGQFQMGNSDSNREAFPREKPQHTTSITRAFHLGMHEVTQAQYERVMGTNPSFFAGVDKPAEQVTWYNAVEFCRQLSRRPEEQAAGNVYRLPTEAEWEYACRSGTTTEFSFGGQRKSLTDYGWFDGNAEQTTHRVGLKKPNPWGLYDMHGNVWEWCHDWYHEYALGAVTNPTGPAKGSLCVIRGGSWFFDAQRCGSAFRFHRAPDVALGRIGFRVLRCATKDASQDDVLRLQLTKLSRAALQEGRPRKKETKNVQVQLTPAQRELGMPYVNTVGMMLIPIPAGHFQMGSADADVWARQREKPQHRVKITRAFYLGATEVTQQQWQAVMSTAPWKGKNKKSNGGSYPATFITWDAAVRFCRKLSYLERAVYRLPTEAEWEYVCRAGTTTAFSFGPRDLNLAEYGWFQLNGLVGSQPVGQRKPNPWGVYDLHGNVWEWCSDRYADGYRTQPVSDPPGPHGPGSDRVVRGGSWFSGARFCRSASRYRQTQTTASDRQGFRVVRVIDVVNSGLPTAD